MTKYSAFGTALNIGAGDVQSETATVVAAGNVTGDGNALVVITCAYMTGSPLTLHVPVLTGDTVAVVGGKIRAFLETDATAVNVRGMFYIGGTGANVLLTLKYPLANDTTLNIRVDNDTCTGLTNAPTSTNTSAGETLTEIAQVQNISGPGISTDTEDVTTHDQATPWEEIIPTLIRSGDCTLDIIYDPNGATHDATTGLLSFVDNKTMVGMSLVFPSTSPVTWNFAAYVISFETGAAHDGSLTASVNVKMIGNPILA
jgi:hypothetical protein